MWLDSAIRPFSDTALATLGGLLCCCWRNIYIWLVQFYSTVHCTHFKALSWSCELTEIKLCSYSSNFDRNTLKAHTISLMIGRKLRLSTTQKNTRTNNTSGKSLCLQQKAHWWGMTKIDSASCTLHQTGTFQVQHAMDACTLCVHTGVSRQLENRWQWCLMHKRVHTKLTKKNPLA